MQTASLHKNQVAKALHKLSTLAGQANVMIELALCHGAIIAVAYTIERYQCHVARPSDIAVHLAESVYLDQRLRHDWLETDVAIFLSEAATSPTLRPEEFAPGVLLSVNASAKVLAMKLHLLGAPLPPDATDARDAEYLLEKISVSSSDQIKHIYARIYPADRFSDTARQLVDRVFRARIATRLGRNPILSHDRAIYVTPPTRKIDHLKRVSQEKTAFSMCGSGKIGVGWSHVNSPITQCHLATFPHLS